MTVAALTYILQAIVISTRGMGPIPKTTLLTPKQGTAITTNYLLASTMYVLLALRLN
jgi:hypothetical protein